MLFIPFLGLVPRICEQLFLDIGDRKQPGITYEVTRYIYTTTVTVYYLGLCVYL